MSVLTKSLSLTDSKQLLFLVTSVDKTWEQKVHLFLSSNITTYKWLKCKHITIIYTYVICKIKKILNSVTL